MSPFPILIFWYQSKLLYLFILSYIIWNWKYSTDPVKVRSHSILSLFWLPQVEVSSSTFSLIITMVCWSQFILAHRSWMWACISSQFHIQWHHTGRLKSVRMGICTQLKLANAKNQGFFPTEPVKYLPSHHCVYVYLYR